MTGDEAGRMLAVGDYLQLDVDCSYFSRGLALSGNHGSRPRPIRWSPLNLRVVVAGFHHLIRCDFFKERFKKKVTTSKALRRAVATEKTPRTNAASVLF